MRRTVALAILLTCSSQAPVQAAASRCAADADCRAYCARRVDGMPCGCAQTDHRCGAVVSARGNVTGGRCSRDAACLVGCRPGETEVGCLSRTEGSSKCLLDGSAHRGPGGLSCACLADVKRCGFAFPRVGR